MGDAANRVSLVARGQSQNIEGTICITASEVHTVFWLPPIIEKLRRMEPKIHIEIIATNQISDLRRREADIAIRNFRPTQPELIAKKIMDYSARFYATPGYLKQVGNLNSIKDLQRADFISFDTSGMVLNALNALGYNLTKKNFPILTENYITHWAMVKQGLGIGIMPEGIGDAEPLVTQVLPELKPITSPIWLTTHRELNTSRRVRIVFDFLATELAKIR